MRKWIWSLALVAGAAWAAGAEDLLARYRAEAPGGFSAPRGKALWTTAVRPVAGEAARSCSACHGTDLKVPGKHVRTGKAIPPLSRSARADALSDAANIEKWFARNCQWTLGRECSAQEKGDVLTYLLQGDK